MLAPLSACTDLFTGNAGVRSQYPALRCSVFPGAESGMPAGLRAAGRQGAAEDPTGGDRDRGGAEEEADHHRGEGDHQDRAGAGRHGDEAG